MYAIRSYYGSAKSWGGNEKWTSMAMQALAKNHKVFFIGKAPHLLEKFGTHAGSTTMAFSSYVDVFTYKKLDSFITKNQIELIVSTKKIEYFLCGLLAKKHGIKHLMRLGVNRKMNIPFWHKLTYFKLNDGLIVNSHFIKQDLCKTSYFDPKRIHRITSYNVCYTKLLRIIKFKVGEFVPKRNVHFSIYT